MRVLKCCLSVTTYALNLNVTAGERRARGFTSVPGEVHGDRRSLL